MYNRFDYMTGFPVIKRPSAIIITAIDTTPINIKPESPRDFRIRMVRLYRSKGYPLGKSKRGLRKWVKNLVLKVANCKTINQAKRKYKKK